MILFFALLVLTVMTVMGVSILANTRFELKNSRDYRQEREAFMLADSSSRLSLLITRIVLHHDLGNPEKIISPSITGPDQPLTIKINKDRLNFETLVNEAKNFDYSERYAEIWSEEGSDTPHLSFLVDNRVVATAVVSLDLMNLVPQGMSLDGGDFYDEGGGEGLRVMIVVSVNGRPLKGQTGSSQEPVSIVTSMLRESI